ncbi:MAG: hypothetical protein PHC75_05135 [Burkholderiales bacterium]|nr:hypothetical protein [Burkholderiales bacterium]
MIYMINKTTLRFYWFGLHEDLLGTWCIRKVYGGLNNNRIKDILVPYDNQDDACQALNACELLRRQHGYVYSNPNNIDSFILTPQTIDEVLKGSNHEIK